MSDRFAHARVHFPFDAATLGNNVSKVDVGTAISHFSASYSTDGWTVGGWARKTVSDGIYPGGFTIDLHMSWEEPDHDSVFVPETDESLGEALANMVHAFDGFLCARFGRRLILGYADVAMPKVKRRKKAA